MSTKESGAVRKGSGIVFTVQRECLVSNVSRDWPQDFRRKKLNLPVIPLKNVYVGPNLVGALRIPHTYMWSPSLVPKPYDWGDHIGRVVLVQTY